MNVKVDRRIGPRTAAVLRNQLNEEQQIALRELESFGWELKFIRRRPFEPKVPVMFDGDRKKYAVLKDDGTLDENPGFVIRTYTGQK
jgi:hypothetical protein